MLVIELIYFKSYRIMLQYCLHIIKQIYREFDMHFEKEIRKNNVSKNPRIIHQVVRNLMSVVELKLATEISWMVFDAIGVEWFLRFFVFDHVIELSAGQWQPQCQLLFELFIEETTKRRLSFKLLIYWNDRLVSIELTISKWASRLAMSSKFRKKMIPVTVLWAAATKCDSLKLLLHNLSMAPSILIRDHQIL